MISTRKATPNGFSSKLRTRELTLKFVSTSLITRSQIHCSIMVWKFLSTQRRKVRIKAWAGTKTAMISATSRMEFVKTWRTMREVTTQPHSRTTSSTTMTRSFSHIRCPILIVISETILLQSSLTHTGASSYARHCYAEPYRVSNVKYLQLPRQTTWITSASERELSSRHECTQEKQ